MHRWEGNCLADLIHLGLGSPRKVILHIFFGWRRSLLRCSVLARWRRKKGVCPGNLFWTRREWRSPRKTQHPTHCQTLKIILKTLMLYRSFKIPFICRCKSDIYFRIGTLVLNLEKGPRMWQGSFFRSKIFFWEFAREKLRGNALFSHSFSHLTDCASILSNLPKFDPRDRARFPSQVKFHAHSVMQKNGPENFAQFLGTLAPTQPCYFDKTPKSSDRATRKGSRLQDSFPLRWGPNSSGHFVRTRARKISGWHR